MAKKFHSFAEFYPFYLSEHKHPACRRLHFIGSSGVLAIVCGACITSRFGWLSLVPVVGYGFAWVGHYFFEHNRPATFRHPWYSLAGDWLMYRDIITGRLPF